MSRYRIVLPTDELATNELRAALSLLEEVVAALYDEYASRLDPDEIEVEVFDDEWPPWWLSADDEEVIEIE